MKFSRLPLFIIYFLATLLCQTLIKCEKIPHGEIEVLKTAKPSLVPTRSKQPTIRPTPGVKSTSLIGSPRFLPNETIVIAPAVVTMSAWTSIADAEVVIYFTIDGSTPTHSSRTIVAGGYITLVKLGVTAVKAFSSLTMTTNHTVVSVVDSAVTTKRYTVTQQCAAPSISPNGGTFAGSVRVRLQSDTPGATILYAVDRPLKSPYTAANNQAVPSGEYVTLTSGSSLLYFRAVKVGQADSDTVTSNRFTILPKVDRPVILPVATQFTVSATLYITCSTPGAQIFYSIDGSDPTDQSLRLLSEDGSVVVDSVGSHSIKAVATEQSMLSSDIATKTFEILLRSVSPQLSPGPGRFVGDVDLLVGCSGETGSVFYTTDGFTTPTAKSLEVSCGQSIKLSAPGVFLIRAYSLLEGKAPSSIVEGSYTLVQPFHDQYPVNTDLPFAVKPATILKTVEKTMQQQSDRPVVGRLLVLQDPIGHTALLEPAGGCNRARGTSSSAGSGSGGALVADSVREYFDSHDPLSSNSSWTWSISTAVDTSSRSNSSSTSTSTGTSTNNHGGQSQRTLTRNNAHVLRQLLGDDTPTEEQLQAWTDEYLSDQSSHSCLFAVSAGYVNSSDGRCFGNVVSDEQPVQTKANLRNTNFGMRNGSYFMGYLSEDEDFLMDSFDFLFSGSSWLVRKGSVFLSTQDGSEQLEDSSLLLSSNEDPAAAVARSAIGYDLSGRLLVLQVSGSSGEASSNAGITLSELASWCLELGFHSAMSTLGGPGMTLVQQDVLVSAEVGTCAAVSGLSDMYPIPDSTHVLCAGPASTVLCIHNQPPPVYPGEPTAAPTVLPSASPSATPSEQPSPAPTAASTTNPTTTPTAAPTASTLPKPAINITATPTWMPTVSAITVNNTALLLTVETLKESVLIYQISTAALGICLILSLLAHIRNCYAKQQSASQETDNNNGGIPSHINAPPAHHPSSSSSQDDRRANSHEWSVPVPAPDTQQQDHKAAFTLPSNSSSSRGGSSGSGSGAAGSAGARGEIKKSSDWRQRLSEFTLDGDSSGDDDKPKPAPTGKKAGRGHRKGDIEMAVVPVAATVTGSGAGGGAAGGGGGGGGTVVSRLSSIISSASASPSPAVTAYSQIRGDSSDDDVESSVNPFHKRTG